jgi:hypothetical protein
VAADVDHLHVKRIYLVSFSYIVIEDLALTCDIKPWPNISSLPKRGTWNCLILGQHDLYAKEVAYICKYFNFVIAICSAYIGALNTIIMTQILLVEMKCFL